MTSAEFVACVAEEKEAMLALYLDPASGSAVARDIEDLRFTPTQKEDLKKILDEVLTDAFYTMLLALDGTASLGGNQQHYELRDQTGAILTGDIEGAAWERFHGKDKK